MRVVLVGGLATSLAWAAGCNGSSVSHQDAAHTNDGGAGSGGMAGGAAGATGGAASATSGRGGTASGGAAGAPLGGAGAVAGNGGRGGSAGAGTSGGGASGASVVGGAGEGGAAEIAEGCDSAAAMLALSALGITPTGTPTTAETELPAELTDANWSLKQEVCVEGGYDLASLAGQSVCLYSADPGISCQENAANIWLVMSDGNVACAYFALKPGTRIAPGVYSITNTLCER